jgi:hypothetical protein
MCCALCEGILMAAEDFAVLPEITLREDRPGRPCPCCITAMTICRIELAVADEHIATGLELERCAAHGVWFDRERLTEFTLAANHLAVPLAARTLAAGSSGELAIYRKCN